MLQWTLHGSYSTIVGQWRCGLNGVCYSEQNVEGTAQQVDRAIVGSMECVSVNIMWKLLHGRWTVVFWLERSVLQWGISGRNCKAGGEQNCSLNWMCYSDHYVENTAQQMDNGIVAWMECVTVNIMSKLQHSKWTVVLWLEWSALQWTLCGSYSTTVGQLYCKFECKLSQWRIWGMLCIARGQWYFGLNGVFYRKIMW